MKHRLILLFGMPRSGTTWIRKIFDSHPDTLYRHEPDSGKALKSMPLIAPVAEIDRHRVVVKRFVAELPRMNTARAAGSLPIFPKRYQSSARLLLKRFAVLAAKASAAFIRGIPILEFSDYEKVTNLHLVWKSIESLGRLGVIVRGIPDCKGFVILRHPGGYVASVLNGEAHRKFSSSTASSDDFPVLRMLLGASPHKSRNPSTEQIESLHPVERLVWRWVLCNEIALSDITDNDNCMFFRYEDLCAHPIAKSRELLQFAGLDWHPQVESFVRRSTSRQSDHYYSVFKDPLKSSTKWEDQLVPADIERIVKIVRQSRLATIYPDISAGPMQRYA